MSDNAADSPPLAQPSAFPIEILVVVLFCGSALSVMAVYFFLERRRAAIRANLQKQLLRYTPVSHDLRLNIPLGETIDGSGIPKVRSVGSNVYMLAYGHSLCSPHAEERRVSDSVRSSLSAYCGEIVQRAADEKEWYRNVALAVIIEKVLTGKAPQVMGLLEEAGRELTGSVGIRELIQQIIELEVMGDVDQIAAVLNSALAAGQPRTRYVVGRALGLLFREPRASDRNLETIRQRQRRYAAIIDTSSLLSCLTVYPTVYEVYERLIQLASPSSETPPATCAVVSQLIELGKGNVYLSYILHVKTLPHCPHVPKELLFQLVLLARTSPFHANIVDEIMATNLREMLADGAKRDTAAAVVVCETADLCVAMQTAAKVLPDTSTLLRDKRQLVERRRAALDRPTSEWIALQVALYRQGAAQLTIKDK